MTPASPRSVYRSRVVQATVPALSLLAVISIVGTMLAGGKNTDEAWFLIFASALIAAFAVLAVRGLRAGVFVQTDGILVRNHFRNLRLSWAEIERFELGPHLLTPRMGHVALRSGRRRPISSIAQTTLEASGLGHGRAQEMLDDLNDLLQFQSQ